MVRYFYAWMPLVIVGTVAILSLPWLGLIALMIFAIVAVGALAALAWGIVVVPYTLGRAISRRWHGRTIAIPRTAPLLGGHRHPHPLRIFGYSQRYAAQRGIDLGAPQLARATYTVTPTVRNATPGQTASRERKAS